ncbi:MAG: oligosaccharide flippase family protein [Geminicoccaceae bacterium]
MTTAARPSTGWWPPTAMHRLALLGAARGGASLLGFVGVTLVAHALTPDELGRWSLALAVQGYALHAGEFGLRSVVTTEARSAGKLLPALLRCYLGLRLALSLLALAAVTLATALASPEQVWLIALVTLSILPMALQLDWLALADERPGLAALVLVLRPLMFLGLIGLCLTALTPTTLALCYLASWTVTAVVSWAALRRSGQEHDGRLPTARGMLRRGAALAFVTLTNQAQLSADLLVIGWSLGAAPAGDYFLASQILVAGLMFANASGQLALARLPELLGKPGRFVDCLATDARRLLWAACGIAAGLALLGPALLPTLFGPEHTEASQALLWLLPWFVLQHPTTLLQAALTAAHLERAVVWANIVMLLALGSGLALAAGGATLGGFAVARSVAELARLACLYLAMRLKLAA